MAFALGIFGFAGDRIGLWRPLPQPVVHAKPLKRHAHAKHTQLAARRSAHAVEHAVAGPPVPAGFAFLVGVIAAALAGLLSVVLRIPSPQPARISLALPDAHFPTQHWDGFSGIAERFDAALRSLVRRSARLVSIGCQFALSISRLIAAAAAEAIHRAAPVAASGCRGALSISRLIVARAAETIHPRQWYRATAERRNAALRSLGHGSARLAAIGRYGALGILRLIAAGAAETIHARPWYRMSWYRRQELAWAVGIAACAFVVGWVLVSVGAR